MFILVTSIIIAHAFVASGGPVRGAPSSRYFDLQGHRGGRGNANENTLPGFAWGLIDGVTTLELDNGITKDGAVVVWHDTLIPSEKCRDTSPVTADDPSFPYVGKYIANLTLAQIKTLDCGSSRLNDFPMQMIHPGTKISTLKEVFDFVECADPKHHMLFNIESKLDPTNPNTTQGVDEFVRLQHAVFENSPYRNSITYQSFEWKSLIAMKALNPKILTSALISSVTIATSENGTSLWLAGIRLKDVPGSSFGIKVANAADSIGANILSPAASSNASPVPDPSTPGYLIFTTKDMVDRAHELGMAVKPWTVNRFNIADQLLSWEVDGIITDYPASTRRWLEQRSLRVSPTYSKEKVLSCLKYHSKRK